LLVVIWNWKIYTNQTGIEARLRAGGLGFESQ